MNAIAENFQLVITAFDNDSAGKQATEKIRGQLLKAQTRKNQVVAVEPFNIPIGKKDIGEMQQAEFDRQLQTLIDSITQQAFIRH